VLITWILLLILALILLRAPIFVALGAPAFLWLYLKGIPLGLAPQRMIGTIDNSILLAVPMFLLAGRLMNLCGATERIFNFAQAVVGHIRGGLGYVSVIASIIFSAMSGSAAADAVGVGTITVRAMRKRGYDPEFAAAITLASSTLAPIVPPSIIMIVYGAAANVSIGRLFIAGLFPGFVIASCLLIAVFLISWFRGYPKGERFSLRRVLAALKDAILVLFTPILIIGGIFSGIFTPTEAGVVAVVYVILIGLIYRTLSFNAFYNEVVAAGTSVGVLMLVISVSGLDGWMFAREQLPMLMAEGITSISDDPTTVTFLILGLVLFLGMFMDATPIILMVVPFAVPLTQMVGIDPVHLGVMFCIMCVIGLITPPVGIALYGVAMVSRLPIEKVFWATLPFFITLLIAIAAMVFMPEAIQWLPNQILG